MTDSPLPTNVANRSSIISRIRCESWWTPPYPMENPSHFDALAERLTLLEESGAVGDEVIKEEFNEAARIQQPFGEAELHRK